MYDNGFAEKLDLDKLSVQLANLQTEKTNALNQIANGYLGLKVLMGMPVQDSLVLTDSLNDQQIRNGMSWKPPTLTIRSVKNTNMVIWVSS